MGKKHPYTTGKLSVMCVNFPDFPHTMGFVPFPHTVGNLWGNPGFVAFSGTVGNLCGNPYNSHML